MSAGDGRSTPVPEVEATGAADAFLLDVREPDEFEAGHAPGAHHLPLAEVLEQPALVPAAETVICVCRSGNRSAHAAAALRAHGRDARNLAGGMRAWVDAGLPVVTATGEPGAVI